jgi:hypothetical protein
LEGTNSAETSQKLDQWRAYRAQNLDPASSNVETKHRGTRSENPNSLRERERERTRASERDAEREKERENVVRGE